MSEDSNPPEAAKADEKPVESKTSEGESAKEKPTGAADEKKPSKRPKKKSGKKPKSEDKRDENSKSSNEPKDAKDSKENEGKEGKGSRRRRSRGGSSKSSKPSRNHDSELLAKHAWKIYLAEISEEGVNMIDDSAAKVLARRCFDLAAVFLDEEQRQS